MLNCLFKNLVYLCSMYSLAQVLSEASSCIDFDFLTIANGDELKKIIIEFCEKNGKTSAEYNAYVKNL